MRPPIFSPVRLLPLLIAFASACASRAAEISLNGQTFTLPDGFTVELAADANLAPRPVSASFDNLGRLYVTDSSGSNEAPAKQLEHPSHRVLRLEDTDGDGKFDKTTVFADKVMFTQGCLWHDGSVYVAAPPSIWKFTDTDGDGVADRREEWFKGGTLTGCANDIHGPYLGPDGYIYWTKGAFAEQRHERPGKKPIYDKAAHILRARPDGSDLDVIMSGGMDNPVEVAFTPEGETVFSSTFIDFTQPGFRDGVGHAIYGGVYGKVNAVLEDGRVKRTSPELLHPFYEAGPAAECGLTRYQGRAFGREYQDNLFATTFNLRKVTRHVLSPKGASYSSQDSDFLVSSSQDFHATDVLEDADGTLLVVDTGGWYKLCCPSSQLAKPDVLGGIYRVRKIGAPRLPSAARPAAYARLAAPPRLAQSEVADLKQAVWKNDQAYASKYRGILQKSAGDAQQGALVRVAAEGAARLRDVKAVPVLLHALSVAASADVFMQHALIFALIEIAAPDATRAGLSSASAPEQRGALIALDQMDDGRLAAKEVLPHLRAQDSALREAATWIFSRHPEWAGEGADFALSLLDGSGPANAEQKRLLGLMAPAPSVQTTFAKKLNDSPADLKGLLLQVVADARPKSFSEEWIEALHKNLAEKDPAILRGAVAAARAAAGDVSKPSAQAIPFRAELLGLASDDARPADVRLGALLAFPGSLQLTNGPLLDFVSKSVEATTPDAPRVQALQVLLRSKLDEAGSLQLAEGLPKVGPLELTRLLQVFEQRPTSAVGEKLLASLKESKAAKSLPLASARQVFAKYPKSVQEAAAGFLESLDADLAKQTSRLEGMLAELKNVPGDVRRGQAIFNSPKAACVSCHRLGYLGGNVGPDLTSIGQARSERDLLEAIVFPSASFVRSYEPVIVTTKDGEAYSGVLRKDAPDEVVLATGPSAEVRLARANINELRPGSVSVMPQGLEQQLSNQELSDLLAFLKNTKWGAQ